MKYLSIEPHFRPTADSFVMDMQDDEFLLMLHNKLNGVKGETILISGYELHRLNFIVDIGFKASINARFKLDSSELRNTLNATNLNEILNRNDLVNPESGFSWWMVFLALSFEWYFVMFSILIGLVIIGIVFLF